MTTRSTVVIVGASVAGVRVAEELRRNAFDGTIVILDEEAELPYDKPPLSKALLAGTTGVEDVTLLSRAAANELGLDLRLSSRASTLNLSRNEVEVDGGDRVGFDQLVIATGARARPSPWGQPEGLHLLRTLGDSQRLRADLERGGRLAVIGGGFIGAEAAATARSMGLAVTMIDILPAPMERVLGPEVGQRFAALHQRHGVQTIFGAGVAEVTGHRGEFRIGLTDGRTVDADYVLVGIGAIPNDDWLASSGLLIDNGVVCDERCQAVDAPGVFAVGDVARWRNPETGRLTRIEHWTSAIEQAALVAHNITHPDDQLDYSPVEYVWSDQYDWKIRVAGNPGHTEGRHVEILGEETDSNRFAALYHDGDTLTGLVVVNWPRALIAGRKALSAGTAYPLVRESLLELAQRPSPAAKGA
ncbi:NAD(P)/FAD-dependent oxidoreductase [[Mycobacterium] burgundiense]|uniref:FAD-dependent oxidoreductase n=1 Tax=[Mycobacterium] burgundiense TaxID=3064286 RepID=A0ABN9NSF2_9MYCO|nr:FAD-dependent oxidoreductase [Mycolicibacterium sp. MU0053]CAJ1511201.1 FAD-dependent oxidoreductase [Mycolicibacterium sp. MU0053]